MVRVRAWSQWNDHGMSVSVKSVDEVAGIADTTVGILPLTDFDNMEPIVTHPTVYAVNNSAGEWLGVDGMYSPSQSFYLSENEILHALSKSEIITDVTIYRVDNSGELIQPRTIPEYTISNIVRAPAWFPATKLAHILEPIAFYIFYQSGHKNGYTRMSKTEIYDIADVMWVDDYLGVGLNEDDLSMLRLMIEEDKYTKIASPISISSE